jgi:hypothetical protein
MKLETGEKNRKMISIKNSCNNDATNNGFGWR